MGTNKQERRAGDRPEDDARPSRAAEPEIRALETPPAYRDDEEAGSADGGVGRVPAGKTDSTLVNEEVESLDADDEDNKFSVDDKVFATLDPLTRRVQVADQTALVTDTVGFVSKLPAQVVAAFRATLEEVSNAAVIVHVVDASAPRHLIRARCQVVDQELDALGCRTTPKLVFYNKLDAMADATSLREKAAVSKHVAVGSAAVVGVEEQLAVLADGCWTC